MPEEHKAEEVKEEFKSAFPSLEKGPGVFYENEKKEIWIGLPLSKVGNPFYLISTLDGCKTACLRYLDVYIAEIQARKQFEISPRGKQVNGIMHDLFQKGKSLITGANA